MPTTEFGSAVATRPRPHGPDLLETVRGNHNTGFERDEHGHADIFARLATEREPKDAYELMHKGHHALNDAAFDWKPCATLVMYRRRRGKCGNSAFLLTWRTSSVAQVHYMANKTCSTVTLVHTALTRRHAKLPAFPRLKEDGNILPCKPLSPKRDAEADGWIHP